MPLPVKPPSATGLRRAIAALAVAWLAAGAILAAVPAGAGPWTRPRGGSFSKFTASYLYTDTEFDAGGEEVPVLNSNPLVQAAAYREVVFSAYTEYGWRDRLTLLGSLPFKIATSARTELSSDASLVREIDVTNAGLSDLHAAVRAALLRGRIPVSLEAGVSVPLGYERVPENGGPALGSGYADAGFALSAGTAGAHAYAAVRGAYRIRGGELDDEIGFGAEAGGHAGRAFAQALLEGWYSTGEIEPLSVSSTTVVANQDVLKLIASAGIRTGATASVAAELYHVLDGRNTAAGTTVAIALVIER